MRQELLVLCPDNSALQAISDWYDELTTEEKVYFTIDSGIVIAHPDPEGNIDTLREEILDLVIDYSNTSANLVRMKMDGSILSSITADVLI